ncbi:MAG: oligosaccharide flippase family protein [Sphingomonas sp.]
MAIVTIMFVPLYIRLLGLQSYALIGIYAALQVWLALLDLGMSPTLGREMARFSAGITSPRGIRDLLRSVEVICGGIAIAAALGIAAGASYAARDWLNSTLPFETLRNAMVLIGVVVAMRFCESVYRSALFGLERQVWYNAVNVVLATLRFGGAALVLYLLSPTIMAFFLWQLAVSILALILLGQKVHRVLPDAPGRTSFSWDAVKEIRAFAAGMIGINVLALILSQADKVILSKALPLASFGYYTLATTMCGVVVAATGPITQAIYPALTRHGSAGETRAFHAAYHWGAQAVTIAAGTITAMFVLFPEDIIRAWSGDAELARSTGGILRYLALAVFTNSLMQIPYFAMLALGKTGFSIRVNVIAVLVEVPLLIWAVPQWGGVGAGAVLLVVNAGVLLISAPLLHRAYFAQLFSSWALGDLAAPIGAIGVIAIMARVVAPTVSSRIICLLYLGAVGASCLIGGLLASSRFRPIVVAGLLRSMRRQPVAADTHG